MPNSHINPPGEEIQQWAERQARILVAGGISPIVVDNAIKRVLGSLPDHDVNLSEWIPDDVAFSATPDAIREARIAWYASFGVPSTFKRILDATH